LTISTMVNILPFRVRTFYSGLLDRPEDDRNEMEKLTFASLLHLPTAVIFVIDPSGLSGEQSNLDKQLNVRNYLRERFPRRPWLDVVSKADLELTDEIKAKLPTGTTFNHICMHIRTHNSAH
jgi:GTP1/Obg family GTP-binding protein